MSHSLGIHGHFPILAYPLEYEGVRGKLTTAQQWPSTSVCTSESSSSDQNTEPQDLKGQIILSVLAPPAVCKLFQERHTDACHVDGDRGMNGCHSLRAEILLKVTEVNHNSPSSPGSCKHSTDSSIPNIIILDRFCHCSYCLVGKTTTWCLLLCRLPRILPSNI